MSGLEQGGPSPEILNEVDQRVRDALNPSAEQVAELRPLLDAATERVARLATNDDEYAAIHRYGGVLAWRMLGQLTDPLPGGVVYQNVGIGLPHDMTLDFRLPYVDGSIDQLYGHFNQDEDFVEVVSAVNGAHSEGVGPAMEAMTEALRATPLYQQFAALEQSVRPAVERPLNSYERMVRGQQVQSTVRQRHGLSPHDGVVPGSAAAMDLNRSLFQLESETVRQPPEENSAAMPWKRAQALGVDLMHRAYRAKFGEDTTIEVEEDPDFKDDAVILINGTEMARFHEAADEVARYMAATYGTGTPEAPTSLAMEFTGSLFVSLYDRAEVPQDVGVFLEDTVTGVAAHVVKSVGNWRLAEKQYIRDHSHDPDYVKDLIYGPGPLVDMEVSYAVHQGKHWKNFGIQRAKLESRRHIERDLNTVYGAVHQYGPKAYADASRIITPAPEKTLPHYDGPVDLSFSLEHVQPYTTIAVPGYRLVRQEGYHYELVADPAVPDPYRRCDVPLGDAAAYLADRYDQLELPSMAAALRRRRNPTVADLTDIIRREAIYDLPVEGSDISIVPRTFEDLTNLCKADRLVVQCTGAAAFLSLSLKDIFPDIGVRQVEGLVLPDRSKPDISAAWHAQVGVRLGDTSYILDATPNANLPRRTGRPARRPKTSRRRATDQGAVLPPAVKPTTQILTPTPPQPLRPADELAAVRERLTEQLRLTFDLPDVTAALKKTVGLAPSDPARRLLNVLGRARLGMMDAPDEPDRLIRYIENLKQLTPDKRQALRTEHYSGTTLDMLSQIAVQAARVIAER